LNEPQATNACNFSPFFSNEGKAKSKRSKNDEEQFEQLESKLVLAGGIHLLKIMLCYSECNETLLRDALTHGLSRSEIALVAGLFVDLLSPIRSKKKNQQSMAPRTVQWISALFDSLRGKLTESEFVTLSRTREAVAAEVSKTEFILSLQDTLTQTISVLKSGATKKSEANRDAATEKERPGYLPPYRIERLVF